MTQIITPISTEALDTEVRLLSKEIKQIDLQIDTVAEKHKALKKLIERLKRERATYAQRKAVVVLQRNQRIVDQAQNYCFLCGGEMTDEENHRHKKGWKP